MEKIEKESWDREKKEKEKHGEKEIKEEWRKERREKGEKSKKEWTKGWKQKMIQEKVMIEKEGKMLKGKKWNKKGLNINQKRRFLGWFFREEKVKREKGIPERVQK